MVQTKNTQISGVLDQLQNNAQTFADLFHVFALHRLERNIGG